MLPIELQVSLLEELRVCQEMIARIEATVAKLEEALMGSLFSAEDPRDVS